jgi:ABC-type multidrug transport system fused ATPase/permease subunit
VTRVPARNQLVGLFRTERRLVAAFLLSSIGRSALTLAGILLIREFLAGLLGDGGGLSVALADTFGATAALWCVAFLLVGTYIGASLLNYYNAVTQQRIVKVIELGVMERLIRHLMHLSVPFFDRQSHGDIIQAIRQDVTELRMVVMAWATLLLEGAVAVGLSVAALMLSPWLTFWSFVVLPLAVYPVYRVARGIRHRSGRVRRRGYVLFDVILQVLRGIRVIKTYRGEEAEAGIAVEKARLYYDELIAITRVRHLARVVLESLAGIGMVVVIVLGGLQVLNGSLDWPALLAFLMALRALHGPLNNANDAYVRMKNHAAGVERIDELLEVRPEVADRVGARALPAAPAVIAFEGVSFGYGRTDVLRDISFTLRAGETLGVAGPSGAGKTTLLNLVARFYDPTGGTVRFDGEDLRAFRLANVYDKLAIVTQEPFLFMTTVRENIRVGRPDASDEEVADAARAAGMEDDIVALPDGWDTVLGVGGRVVSTGQAQRINIARALLKNAPILLLDEATSSLDSLAEARVQRGIERLMEGRTTVIVAHRLSTLRNADRILVLDQGRAVGLAPHAELVRTCPLYRWMWETQQLGGESKSAAVDEPTRIEPPAAT